MPQNHNSVKKVKAYPIAVLLKMSSGTGSGQILKLTDKGMLAEVSALHLQPGDLLEVSFELPVLHRLVSSSVIVVKFYSQWNGQKNAAPVPQAPPQTTAEGKPKSPAGPMSSANLAITHLVELHFQNLADSHLNQIHAFLKALSKNG